MESPVRICLSAAIVVHLLVLSSSNAHSSAIPPSTPSESQAAALDVRRTRSGYARVNSTTWLHRRTTGKPKEDLRINDITPTTNSEESVQTTEEKPKMVRGPVRYNTQKYKSSTPAYRRRGLSSTSTAPTTSKKTDLEVVTPTPAKKNISQIIDSMRSYSKTMKSSYSSSTAAPDREYDSDEEEIFSTDDHEDNEFDITRFTSSEFHDEDNVYSFSPSSSGDLYPQRTNDFSGKTTHFSHSPKSQPYKQSTSHSYDNFFSELDLSSPPRNDQFDKRYQEIAQSITHNIDRHIGLSTKPDSTHSENIEGVDVTKSLKVEQFLNKKPSNSSQMYIHNTTTIQVTDNEAEGSSLSDVHGTSIYFETSMLSTESYGTDIITEGDCDNDTRTEESTPSTPLEKEEKIPVRVTTPSTMTTTETSYIQTIATNYPNRNFRVSPKRLNLSTASSKEITKESAFTKKSNDLSSNSLLKPTITGRIQYTSPKPPRITHRMLVKSSSTKPSYPTTIYAEHFNIKDKSSNDTPDRKQLLTTVSSNIDPVYETEISGTKKVVYSQTISDNSIPGLRKRGSTKFVTTPAIETVSLEESSSEYMPIPTASSSWAALAGNIKTPASTSFAVNSTSLRTKTLDENELQNVSEIPVIQPSSTTSTTTTTISNSINIDQIQEQPQIFGQWTPIHSLPLSISSTTAPPYSSSDIKKDVTAKPIENPPTTQPSQSSPGKPDTDATSASSSMISGWEPVNVTVISQQTEYTTNVQTSANNEVDSNAKLLSNLSTPLLEDDITSTLFPSNNLQELKNSSNIPINMITETTTFAYVPISTISSTHIAPTHVPVEEPTTTTTSEIVEPSTWHPVFPALNTNHDTKFVEDITITTYRPTFVASEVTEKVYTTESQTVTVPENFPTTTPNYVKESSPTTTQKSEEITMINVKYTIRRETTTPKTAPKTTTEATTTTTVAVTTSTPEEITTPKPEETTDVAVELNTTEDNKETSMHTNVTEVVTHESTIEMTDAEITRTEYFEVDTTTIGKIIINENLTTIPTEAVTEHTTEGDVATRLGSTFNDMTTYSPNTTEPEESSSATGVAIAVSTIGVIALLLLIGLLLVLRRRRQRGRRCGVYAQRCTPVSLDAYSLDSVSVGRRKGAPRLRASKRSYGNPAYDDEVVISHPMQYAALANFALDADSMAAEFAEIPAGSVRADEVPPGCETKNRYSNVLPLPETRVPLQRIGDDPATEYINANFVTGPGNIKNYYIACQAPLANTVADFWRMIWEQDSRLIVMLTEYMENGVEKCYEYLPPSEVTDNKRTFGNFQVVLKRREHRDKYAVSSVQLVELGTRRWREVSHLWYFWPAKGVPDDYDSVINFVSEMRSHMKIAQNAKEFDEDGEDTSVEVGSRSTAEGSPGGRRVYSPQRAEELMRSNGANGTLGRMKAAAENGGVRPCVVTCASGAGRTGALLALDLCARALEGAGTVDVPRTVRALRSARPHALQNKSQYMFLYKVLSEYGNKLTGGGVDSI